MDAATSALPTLRPLGARVAAVAVCLVAACLLTTTRADAAAPSCVPAADIVSPSCFEGGDGNLVVNHAAHSDWKTLTATQTALPDMTGAADDRFTGGKEMSPNGWTIGTGANAVSPSKSDLVRAVVASQEVSAIAGANPTFLYAAFQLAGDSGNTNLSLELNQLGTTFHNAAGYDVPKRKTNDVLITYDGKSGAFNVGICKWFGDSVAGEEIGEVQSNDAFGWYQINPITGARTTKLNGSDNCTALPATVAIGGSNGAGALPNSGADLAIPTFPSTIAIDTFGELSINLDAAFNGTTGNACFSFGGAWIHTRSSDTVTSNPVDYSVPVGIPATGNCAITVEKQVSTSANGPFTDSDTAATALVTSASTDPLFYKINVHNAGTTTLDPLTSSQITDANCGTLSGPDTTGDASPSTFDAGDTWVFTCSQTKANGGWAAGDTYTNTAIVLPSHSGAPLTGFCAAVSHPCRDDAVTKFKALPTLATQATSADTGSTISDTATITGGDSPTGTVPFKASGPNAATCAT